MIIMMDKRHKANKIICMGNVCVVQVRETR